MKVSYRVDTFKDFNGDLRHFVIAAVSLPTTALVEEFDKDDEYAFEAEYTEDCSKVLLLGFSACQSSDAFDEEIGKKIALGKALKGRKYALYATNKGLINSGMVESLLDQEVKFFKKDPGYYLKSYRDAENRYKKNTAKYAILNEMSDEDRMVLSWLKRTNKKWMENVFNLANIVL